MIHSSSYKPRIIPTSADVASAEIDRLQELSKTTTFNRTKIEEIGRSGLVDWKKTAPSVTVTARQLEYGSLEFFRKLTGKGDSVNTIEFTDFKTPYVDIVGYKTDDNGAFLGTVWYPNLRTSGFSINVGDPDALIERSFNLMGEDEIILVNDNKYLITKRYTLTAGTDQTITISDPAPIADPDNSGQYLFKVVRVRSGAGTILTHGTDWSYDGTDTLTINGSSSSGDVILVWYSAGSYITGQSTFTLNDSDLSGITADSCDIFLVTSSRATRLQSVTFDVAFDRYDVKEIGNDEVVVRGSKDTTVTVTLGRILEDYTIEEIIRGQAGNSYGKLDIRKFTDNISLILKVYSDATKSTFKIGYKVTDLAPSGMDITAPLNDYLNTSNSLTGENGFCTTVEALL